ncbi:Rac GTPase-activating protein BCR/ABR [Fusarium falciforme]|uniref:Rac GTPase-activating protein BCR/ABR n=1 Tax=Fusarium falciforme TaxID=195108 RepID=A0A9W8RHJ9_9HYPO|nr:Rac GTPase-activating protein BCR/ABR [Fusarium falciforme]
MTHQSRRRRNSPSSTRSSRVRSASPARELSSSAPRPFGSARSSQGRNSIPACDRCRSFKKKCSRTFPACSLCASAGQSCSYSAPPATPEAEALQLRARVQWFSDYINGHLLETHHGARIEDIETGSDLAALLGSRLNLSPTDQATLQEQARGQNVLDALSSSDLSPAQVQVGLLPSHAEPGHSGLEPPSLGVQIDGSITTSPIDSDSARPTGRQVSHQSSTDTHDLEADSFAAGHGLPADAAARRFVDAYFRNVNGAYPFVNQAKILENLETLGDLAQRLRDSQSTLLYLVMSIGCTTLERASRVPRDTAKQFKVAYAEIIQECVCRDSIESVQILMLLALYSLFDPAGALVYSIVGIAARQAITIGLTRRPVDENTYPPAETELRHRLYWSIFALDRMMAVSQGLPVALPDNADVPFPGLTVEEFASGERITYARRLQTSRHVIQLRQLEGRILEQIHFRREADIAELTPLDRRATLSSLRATIEDWHSQGCLMSPIGGDNTTIHSSTTWLSARYYYLLLLLYYPNHFNSSAGAVSRQELQQFAQRQLQATSALFQQQQLPLNCNTLYRLMPICLVLMYDFVEICRSANWTSQSTFPFLARDEVAVALSVLEAFPKEWSLAHRAAQVVRQFAGVISGGMAAFFSDEAVFPLGAAGGATTTGENAAGEVYGGKESLPVLMKPCIARLTSLMQEMMGKSTCFQFVEYPSDDNKRADSQGAAISHQKPHQPYLQQQLQQQALPPVMSQVAINRDEMDGIQQVGVGDDDVIGYGWGAIDLDFL